MPFIVDHSIPRAAADVWKIATDWTVAEYWLGVNKLRAANLRADAESRRQVELHGAR